MALPDAACAVILVPVESRWSDMPMKKHMKPHCFRPSDLIRAIHHAHNH